MPKNLVFIRHGESQANVRLAKIKESLILTEENVTYPDRSWELTAKGKAQAKAIGQIFKPEGVAHMWFDQHYVSPYVRTKQTAAMLDIDYAKWEMIREIRERSWGDIDSIPTASFKSKYPNNYGLHLKDPLYWMPPGGESLASVAEGRLNAFFAKLHRDNAGENVICVTHHDIMLGARLVLEHLSDEEFTEKLISKELSFPNASALCYTRVDPETKDLHSKLAFVKTISIDDEGNIHTDGWSKISKPIFSNEDLLKSI